MDTAEPATIRCHPSIPFIEVGTTLDFARRGGYADDPAFTGTADEWTFLLAGESGNVICWSEAEALQEAEEQLFVAEGDLVGEQIRRALESGDVELALTLAERRGYWHGALAERDRICGVLEPLIEKLKAGG